ncbi:MAG: DHH family phosphoesterase, partial [Puniceicoccales bacterium]
MYYPEEFGGAFREILKSLEGKRVAILGHLRPDADCIGSQVALCRILQSQGVEAVCLNQHPTPRVLLPFVADTPWASPEDFDPAGWTAVAVDCADTSRFGPVIQSFFPTYLANIDHHRSNPEYAQHNIVDANSAATGEMLSGLFLDSGLEIDAVTAQALFVAIATDTGHFRYAATGPRVFELCAELLRRGASPALTSEHLFENEPFAKIDLLRRFLGSVQLDLDGRLCYGVLPYGIFE